MKTRSITLLIITLSLILFTGSVLAQNEKPVESQSTQTQAPAVTASADGSAVRFAASGQVLQVRLEVYSATGELVFDSGLRNGSVIDWKAADATKPVADGSYLTVVTVRDFNNKFGQRLGTMNVQAGQLTLGVATKTELSPAQSQSLSARRKAQKIEAEGNNESLTVLRQGKERSTVVAAHDGQNGQLTSTSGALTLSTGDFFAGKEHEQMRVTPDGRVGIGTTNPQATLDVAGTISARDGIRFGDGSVLTSANALKGTNGGVALAAVGGTTENISGSGTTGKIVKWTNGPTGVAGDSIITELNGKIGIGTATPNNALHVVGSVELEAAANGVGVNPTITNPSRTAGFAQVQFYPASGVDVATSFSVVPRGSGQANNRAQFSIFNTDFIANNQAYEFLTMRARGNDFVVGTGKVGAGVIRPIIFSAGLMTDNVTNNNQLVLAADGSVGVGTNAPTQKFEVAGSIKIAGQGNAIFFPDGTSMTSAAVVAGQMTGNSIVNAINGPNTSLLIADNRLNPNVAKLNAQNAWTGQNTFVNGLSANGVAITNVGNPVSATDATNKAYTDANFVQFVPGAEQLSVGDANGTAAMINLRGGSTCCSGPGGHTPAWFKVFQNGSFVATGNLGIGVSPMQGKGYRTSWDSYKGAFRSGYADAEWDDANVGFFSWAGGSNSTAIGLYALAFGDTNSAESTSSIVFGSGNQVKGAAGFSAGAGNRVCDTYGVALGNNAKSGGPLINGKCDPDSFNIHGLAAVAIGYNVTADQDHTTAMGKFASNNGFTGTFVWSDGSATQSADTFRNTANNEFAARATGGFRFRTNLAGTTGCNLPAGSGVFNCTSSRTTKENFSLVDGNDVLARLRKVQVSTWNYIAEGQQSRHLGPMAEDFYGAFKLGTTDKAIGIQDAVGVSLAAVKALDARTLELQKKTAEVEKLRTEVDELRSMNASFAARLAALEQNARKAPTRKAKARRG
jgi:hypothetical protein